MTARKEKNRLAGRSRVGATVVETAFVLPVLGIFLAGIMEFGHMYLVTATLNGAAKQASRRGSVEGNTTADVLERAMEVVSSCVDSSKATFYVKDASVFEDVNVDVNTMDYANLPDIELAEAQTTQIFLVRIEVPYDEVALLPPFWVKDFTIYGQSMMRHE